jgi:tetratricopeptide (TPR) repeat protein
MLRSTAAIGILLLANGASAADQPRYEAPPAWVKTMEIPKPTTPGGSGATRILLEDWQDRFVPDGVDIYWQRAERIESPQGLANIGNLAFDWNPDTETLLIHHARIIRGDKTIDLLAEGHRFIILRRENRLEYAMLDGSLTAAMQPEGLQVGDILDIAIGYEMRDPITRGRSWRILSMPAEPADVFAIRELWPNTETPHWRVGPGLDQPKVTKTADGSELSITMTGAVRPQAPKQSPDRYSRPGLFEISEAASWPEVSALMAPYYDKASQLNPDSPLHAEVARIKTGSSDPKVQAAMALSLVENQVRYLFLGMNNGGFIPAAADLNWSRRFGDCKGKSVLLVALLRELGIKAEPALVDTRFGDDLDARPAMVGVFDHVIVRAEISGKVYWLDGTRADDRTLDDLQIPNFHWALPLRASGATLEKLVVPPFDKPDEATTLRLDASTGIDAPAPAHGEYVLRNDSAIAYKERLADMSTDQITDFIRDYWRKEYYWIDVAKVGAVYDEKTGEERVTMDGTAHIPWKDAGQGRIRRYEVDGAVLGWQPDYARGPGPNQDAPYSVRFPYFDKTTITVVLPGDGKGFGIDGSEVDKTIGPWEFKRTARIDKTTFTMEASTRAIAPEFPAAAADTVAKVLRDMSDFTIYLRAPTAEELATADTKHPKTVEDFVARAGVEVEAKDFKAALADLDQAVLLKPDSATPYAARVFADIGAGMLKRATDDADKAAEIAPGLPVVLRAQGVLSIAKAQYLQAIDQLTKALTQEPDDAYSLEMRGIAHQALNQTDQALSDYAGALRQPSGRPEIYAMRAAILIERGEGDAALSEAGKYLAAAPKDPHAHIIRGHALAVLGRNVEAVQEVDRAIAAMPNEASFYMDRAQVRPANDTAKRLADIDKAIARAPRPLQAYLLRADIYLAAKQVGQAIKALDDASKIAPADLNIVRRRKYLLEDNHLYAKAIPDIDRLFTAVPEDTELLVDRCRDEALAENLLKSALADCQKALTINVDIDEGFEWRAFTYLRMGKLEEAAADYDTFLKRRPNSPSGHFGQGIVALRQHREDEGQRDLAIARRGNASIDAQFAGLKRAASWYGLTEAEMTPRAVDLPPVTVNDFIARGFGAINHQDYRAGIADFDRALAIDPKSALALANRGIAHYWLQEFDLAKADFDKAAENNPLEPVTFRGRGLIALHDGNNQAAVEAFTQSIKYDPKNTFAFNSRSSAYQNLNELDKAIADIDASLRLEPNQPGLYARRSNLYTLVGQGDKALEDADRAVAANGDNAFAHFARGRALWRLSRKDEAQAEFDRSIALHPDVYTYLLRAGLNLDHPDKALTDINNALGMDPNNVDAYLIRAQLYEKAGDFNQALVDVDRALTLAPKVAQIRLRRINLLARKHDYAHAIAENDTLVAEAPKDAGLLNSRCWMRAMWGQELTVALADCDASLGISPASPDTLDSRGLVNLRLGHLDEALADYNAALEKRPKAASSLYGRGLVELRKGKPSDGQADLAAARSINPKIDTEYANYGLTP